MVLSGSVRSAGHLKQRLGSPKTIMGSEWRRLRRRSGAAFRAHPSPRDHHACHAATWHGVQTVIKPRGSRDGGPTDSRAERRHNSPRTDRARPALAIIMRAMLRDSTEFSPACSANRQELEPNSQARAPQQKKPLIPTSLIPRPRSAPGSKAIPSCILVSLPAPVGSIHIRRVRL